MGKGGNKRRQGKPSRPFRLGPVGPAFAIHWTERHAGDRALERLRVLGLDDDAIEALIRSPIGKKRDERDEHDPDRIRRWSVTFAPCSDGKHHQILFVFVVSEEPTESTPGAIIMITVIDKGPTA